MASGSHGRCADCRWPKRYGAIRPTRHSRRGRAKWPWPPVRTRRRTARSEQAIRLNPQLAAGWALRGRVFSRLNQPDRALADLQRALELSPQGADVLFDLAILYRQQGQLARALTTLHSLLDSYPPGEEPQMALMLEGQTLMALGRPHQAADSLLAASRRGPPNAEILFLLAQAQSSAGQYAAAAAAAEQALAIDSTHTASRQLIAQLVRITASADPDRR